MKIKFKTKKLPLFAGIICLFISLPCSILSITWMLEPECTGEDRIAWIAMLVILGIIPTFFAIISIIAYFVINKNLKFALKKYGEQNLIDNINNHTIEKFDIPFLNGSVYFTDRFVIDPGEAIIEYNEISWMYKHIERTNNVSQAFLCFETCDGKQHRICRNINDSQLSKYMQLCYSMNPEIIMGHTKENIMKHKARVNQYKKSK